MLKIRNSCEIDDLIREVVAKTGKSYNEIEKAFFKTGKYPESTKTYLTTKFGPIVKRDGFEWLNDCLTLILSEAKIDDIYVTNAI